MLERTLNLRTIEKHLTTAVIGRASGWSNELWDTLESTNKRAHELAVLGASEGVMVLAREQTAGRGRQGRTWVSPPDSGIYVSFLLKPNLAAPELALVSLTAGVASARAIARISGVKVRLKWVNDLVAGGKKLGGILAEMPSASSLAGFRQDSPKKFHGMPLILGIGINLRFCDEFMPEDLKARAESLERLAGQPVNDNLLVAALAGEIEQQYFALREGQQRAIIQEWKQLSVTLDKPIKAVWGDHIIEGMATDITDNGGLVVTTNKDKTVILSAGEVSIRNPDGTYV